MKRSFSSLICRPAGWSQIRWAVTVAAGLATESARAQPFTVGPVNTADREDVRTLFNSVYLPGEGPIALEWTGNIVGCNFRTIAQSVKDRTQVRVNFYRALAGMPGTVTFTPTNDALAQAGALVNSANRITSHGPPPTSTCYSEQAAEGAKSNLIGQHNNQGLGPKAIDTWMDDSSFNNEAVGHRRHVIEPSRLTMGYGDVPATGGGVAPNGYPSTAALYVFGATSPQRPPTRDEFVAWPPRGFVPYQLFSPRWNFGLPGADFANTTVTLTRNGTNLPVTIQNRGTGPVTASLTFIRTDQVNVVVRNFPPPADDPYTVTLNNVVVNGTPRNFTYDVIFFDPAVPGAGYTPLVVTGPDRPPLNQNTTYNFTTLPLANGYQWRASKLAALNLTDGAENGLVNFDAVVTTYAPVTTTTKATGNAGFRLRRTGNSAEQQTLTFKRALLANANSQISFKSRLIMTRSYASSVQISLDGGTSWRTVFSLPETDNTEPAFTDKVVSLAAFADRQIQVRFALVNTGGSFFSGEEAAWYFDDVTFINLQELIQPPTINNVMTTSFGFNPAEPADFILDVRPQIFGQYFGEWGQAKRVSTITTVPTAPMIATQPQGQTVVPGANVTFTVVAQGTAPLTYGWRRDGTPLTDGAGVQGSTTATLTLQNVQVGQAGSYTVGVTNAVGNALSTPAVLVLNEAPGLASALDTTGLNWTTAGNANWYVQTTNTHDNVDAAQSGRIADNQESRMETMINGPATVAFWWRVASEQNYDFLRVELDGAQQFRISGTVNWEQKTIAVPAGTHTLRWVYAKDTSAAAAGADAGWVDQVEIRQAQPPPSLADALDTTNITWAATGDRPWFSQTTTTHDGADAVQSGPIADSQASRLEATILGPANLSFWWKVDSEQNYDFLTFELDNVQPATAAPISGNVNWEQKTVPIPAGTHVIRWSYTKDSSTIGGADAGWVDQVVLTRLTPGEAGEAPPLLEFTASGNKLRITWPEVAVNFKLQAATSLSAGDWTDVPENDISKADGQFFIIVNTSVGSKFYRLVEAP